MGLFRGRFLPFPGLNEYPFSLGALASRRRLSVRIPICAVQEHATNYPRRATGVRIHPIDRDTEIRYGFRIVIQGDFGTLHGFGGVRGR